MLAFLGVASAPAYAGTAEDVSSLPTLDALTRAEVPLSNGGKWAALSWAGGTNPTGQDTTTGWGPYSSLPATSGAYWTPTTFTDKSGSAAALTVSTLPSTENAYISLWIDMPSPSSAKSGYQLRYTPAAGGGYAVKLSKWSAGTETVLASNGSASIFNGATMAISDTGDTVTAWHKTAAGGTFSPLLSATDSTYKNGYAGIDGGGFNRNTNFKAGTFFDPAAQEIAALPTPDALTRAEVPLSNGGKWAALSWAGGTNPTGQDTTTGWGPYSSLPTINGAYWTPSTFADKSGNAAAITMAAMPSAENYFSLWLDMPSPGSAKSGYQLRYNPGPGETYAVKLSKWAAGSETVLASTGSISVFNGTTIAISDTGTTVTAWQKASGGSTFSPLLSATDSTYTSGYAGIEGGGFSRSTNFKVGTFLAETIAAQGADGAMKVLSPTSGVIDPGLAMKSGTGPGFTALPNGSHTIAFQGSDGNLWTYSSKASAANTGLGMMAGTSPSIATMADGSYIVAFQGSDGNLRTHTSKESLNLQLGMKSGTSPAITTMSDGSYVIAFQASDGNLWTYSSTTSWANRGLGMLAGTSPSVAALPNGSYVVAIQASNGYLWTYSSTTNSGTSRGLGMLAGTSPGITALPDSSYVVAIQANNGYLWTYSSATNSGTSRGLQMASGTSPAMIPKEIALPETTISSNASNGTVPPNVAFAFTSSAGSSFECSLDGGAYSACASPKAYEGLAEGSHTFRVRAVNLAGADQTPAERSFQTFTAAQAIAKTPLLDDFNRDESPLATSNWGKTSWTTEIGIVRDGTYKGYGPGNNLSGAYWKPTTFNDTQGATLTTATMSNGPIDAEEYLSLWLNSPSPTTQKSGYEARFTGTNGSSSSYKAELSRWVSGVKTVLTSKEGVSLPAGTTVALGETGSHLTVWSGKSGTYTPILAGYNSTYTSGYAGIEMIGGARTAHSFKAGNMDLVPPNTTIASGPTGTVLLEQAVFTFTSTESNSSFECSVDGGAYSACPNPKSFTVLATGAHSLKARAVDLGGNQDPTPVERSFSIVQPPSATANAATSIKATQATLNASVNPNLSATTYQFEYGTTTSYGSKVPASAKSIGSGGAAVEVSEPITGLAMGTTYNYRISATNAWGTTKSANKTFTTTAAPAISLTTTGGLKADQANLVAFLNPKGATTTYQFEIGKTTSYGTKLPTSPKSVGSGYGTVAGAETATGLTEGQLYHFRVVATNEVGTTYGPDSTFTTPYLPEAQTDTGEPVDANEAILIGDVNPNGLETSYKFEYGLTTSYGMESSVGYEEIGDGDVLTEVTEPVAHLEPKTTYHYRVVATSSAGTEFGNDQTVTTSAATATPQYEDELEAEELAFTGSLNGQPPPEFYGMMWSGDIKTMDDASTMNAIRASGAKWLRLMMYNDPTKYPPESYDEIFRMAARRDITVLPYFETGGAPSVNDTGFMNFVKTSINKYGPGGSFWNTHSPKMPAVWWEIGNEPNRGDTVPGTFKPNPANFGPFFKKASDEAKSAGPVKILLSGLFATPSTNLQNCGDMTCRMTIANWVNQMGYRNAYDALSIHPYVFKVGGDGEGGGHEPKSAEDKRRAVDRIHDYLREAERVSGGNPIWVTEFGFPTKSQAPVPSVTELMQQELITAAFNRIKADRGELNIPHAFYYNIQDRPEPAWPAGSGLRTFKGKKKKGWGAYANAAGGNPAYPKPTSQTQRPLVSLFAKQATMRSSIDTYGAHAETHVDYWRPGPDPVVEDTDPVQVEGLEELEGEQDVTSTATGLQPQTDYRYHTVTVNEEGDVTVGENYDFTTPQFLTNHVKRILDGQPGSVWVEGQVSGFPGAEVRVNFRKKVNGQYQPQEDKSRTVIADANGHYETGYVGVGGGEWDTRSIFLAQAGHPEWPSPYDPFQVFDGVLIKAKHSLKCMDVDSKQQQDGVLIMHGECNWGNNQVFTLRPKGAFSPDLEIVARHSGKCVDIAWASVNDGADVVQHGCNGGDNQAFRESEPWEGNPEVGEYTTLKAVHSGKCLDVENANQGWGPFKQYTCSGVAQQRFKYQRVDAAPIKTETGLTPSPILHGNGQGGPLGLVTISGHLTAGAYPMTNRIVQVQFEKVVNGQWQPAGGEPLPVNSAGEYRFNDYGLAPGIWKVRGLFVGDSEFGQSASQWHEFSIWQANRLVARHSGRCMTLSENKNVNGQKLIQWDCAGSGSLQDGQTFWFWPVGNNVYEITVISTGKCLDIAWASGEDGARLVQHDCNHFNNQKFRVIEIQGQLPWYAIQPIHVNNKCVDVVGGVNATGNGPEIGQWTCTWAGNQQWRIDGVVSG